MTTPKDKNLFREESPYSDILGVDPSVVKEKVRRGGGEKGEDLLTSTDLFGRDLDKFEAEGAEFFERVRKAYWELAREDPERVRMIDGARPLDEVKAQVEDLLTCL